MPRFVTLILPAVLALPAIAFAGAAAGTVSASLMIPGVGATAGVANNQAAKVNIGQFLKVDPTTGAVFVDRAAGTADTGTLGLFTFEKPGDGAPLVFDRATGTYAKPTGTVIRWDSFVRDSGVYDNSSALNGDSASSFSFAVSANVDPFMTYGLSVKNNSGSTNSYSFVFSESLVPTVNGAYSVYSDISGSVVNAVSGTTLTLNPTPGSTVQKVFLDDGYGVFTNANVDVGSSFSYAGTGSTFYGGSGSASAGGSGSYTAWEFRTDFSLTGGKDVATLSGYAEISAIPEPETYALFAAGLLGVGMMVRRRSQG